MNETSKSQNSLSKRENLRFRTRFLPFFFVFICVYGRPYTDSSTEFVCNKSLELNLLRRSSTIRCGLLVTDNSISGGFCWFLVVVVA